MRYPLVFRFFGLKSLRTSLGDWRRRGDLFSQARAILHIVHAMEMRTILDLFFAMRFAEQPSSLETLVKWIHCGQWPAKTKLGGAGWRLFTGLYTDWVGTSHTVELH